jgi:hypothetical protein
LRCRTARQRHSPAANPRLLTNNPALGSILYSSEVIIWLSRTKSRRGILIVRIANPVSGDMGSAVAD